MNSPLCLRTRIGAVEPAPHRTTVGSPSTTAESRGASRTLISDGAPAAHDTDAEQPFVCRYVHDCVGSVLQSGWPLWLSRAVPVFGPASNRLNGPAVRPSPWERPGMLTCAPRRALRRRGQPALRAPGAYRAAPAAAEPTRCRRSASEGPR